MIICTAAPIFAGLAMSARPSNPEWIIALRSVSVTSSSTRAPCRSAAVVLSACRAGSVGREPASPDTVGNVKTAAGGSGGAVPGSPERASFVSRRSASAGVGVFSGAGNFGTLAPSSPDSPPDRGGGAEPGSSGRASA
jgi:hypothetical protein